VEGCPERDVRGIDLNFLFIRLEVGDFSRVWSEIAWKVEYDGLVRKALPITGPERGRFLY
jgi:hypothetical protein